MTASAEVAAAAVPSSGTPVLSARRRPSALCWRRGAGRGSFPGGGCRLAGRPGPPGARMDRDGVLCPAPAGRASQVLTGDSLGRGACGNVAGLRSARAMLRPQPLATDPSKEGIPGCPGLHCCPEHLESTGTPTGARPVSTHAVGTTPTPSVSAQRRGPWGPLGLCRGPSWAQWRGSSLPGPHPLENSSIHPRL